MSIVFWFVLSDIFHYIIEYIYILYINGCQDFQLIKPILFITLSELYIDLLTNSMRNRRQVIPIREEHQKQQTQSISLNSDSMPRQNQMVEGIEQYQYGDLDFSDQMDRALQSSEEQKQLRPEQIKNVIDVDRLNQYYLSRKNKDISQTRAGISQYMHENLERTQQDHHINHGKSREKAYENSSMPENQLFNINSFLNSRPTNKNRGDHRRVESQRDKHNSNAFEKVLKQHSKNKNGKMNKKYNLFPDEQQKSRNSTSNPYKAKNQKIRQFIQAYSKKHIQFNKSKPSVTNQSQQSITLITLPQPPEPQHQPSNKPYHIHNHQLHNKNNRKHKAQSLIHSHNHNINFDEDADCNDSTRSKLFEVRFQTAKINFMDNFLPQSMKIGNNAYNYWKYTNSKQNNKFYGCNFGNSMGTNMRIV